ncbi:hypothetical protein FQ775_14880 [Nitratireductor mangrovi]|uniref:Uncharacterized protein n=1 Tax=Nitratireductor mangrovi TaxID=2599600 RepID=A0A5B8L0N2_9HYPH|nr:hypothetical protein [Nitratireductor mangrovi]QDZ01557.1 hypothetical protein FQ775_14880 [Nitratireductor mangrovi]
MKPATILPRRKPLARLFLATIAAVAIGNATSARSADNAITTNESYVEQVTRTPSVDITDIDAVFDYVFAQLGDEVTVYPTENYYYFKFLHGAVPYAGNFRLDTADRDRGIIHFAYFSENNPFTEQKVSEHRAYSTEHGVTVEKKDELIYAVTRGERTVTFKLNDLRGVEPPPSMVGKSETYLGPVFDESGVQMFLMWNQDAKMFAYVLDENVPSEDYFQSGASSQIKIGLRTGFAWYKDRYYDRWLLVGVRAYETSLNTFFDGPFDQLPDNFLKGDALRRALLELSPEVEGQIDRFGNSRDLTGRMLVDPYLLYNEEDELAILDQCAAAAVDEETYYPCFAIGQSK